MGGDLDKTKRAVEEDYREAVSMRHLQLATSQLEPGTWAVSRIKSVPGSSGLSVCDLGPLGEGDEFRKAVCIYPTHLRPGVETAKLKFVLSAGHDVEVQLKMEGYFIC